MKALIGFLFLGLSYSTLNAQTVCSGTAVPQYASSVAPTFSLAAPGVAVEQITSSGPNFLSYIDIPFYSTAANRIVYDHGTPSVAVTANPDGSGAQRVSTSPLQDLFLSQDGRLVYYWSAGTVRGTRDVYGVFITKTGPCREVRLTRLSMVPPAGQPVPELSTSTPDPTTGENIIAFSPDNLLHEVREDGTLLPTINLPDYQNADTFHRIRLNPKFSNIVFYKREDPAGGGAFSELWVVDLNNPTLAYDVAKGVPAGHPVWSADGRSIGFLNSNSSKWEVISIVNPDRTLNTAFSTAAVGPAYTDFCSWAPDGSQFICTSDRNAGLKLYLMSLDGAQTKFLINTDARALTYNGVPFARFAGTKNQVYFRSDKTDVPQVYLLAGYQPF